MPRLSRVQRSDKTLKVIVTFPDDEDGNPVEPVHLEVYPNRITLGTMQRARELSDTSDLSAVARLFFEFMHAWDLEDEKGKPLPFTDDTARLLTIETFNALTMAVLEAVRPNLTTSTA